MKKEYNIKETITKHLKLTTGNDDRNSEDIVSRSGYNVHQRLKYGHLYTWTAEVA